MNFDDILRADRCRDMDELINFEPDPDHSPDAGTGLISPIAYALQRGNLLRRKNPTYWYWAPVEAATRGFEASNTVVGGKCALPSALLVINYYYYYQRNALITYNAVFCYKIWKICRF